MCAYFGTYRDKTPSVCISNLLSMSSYGAYWLTISQFSTVHRPNEVSTSGLLSVMFQVVLHDLHILGVRNGDSPNIFQF